MKTLILSDIHSNWSALKAVLDAEQNVDQIICLGDLVNYGPQPLECLTWAMHFDPPPRLIQGNHDRAFALNKPARRASEPSLADAMQASTNSLLTGEMRRFLANLKPSSEFSHGSALWFLFHASTRNRLPATFAESNPLWPWETDIVLLGHPDKLFLLAGHPEVLLLALGHSSIQTRWGETEVINPGSVGRPLDGDPRAAYAVSEGGKITLHRVQYDIAETAQAYAPLPVDDSVKKALILSLYSGRPVPSQNDIHLSPTESPSIAA